jgi:hypothetical protein
MDQAGLRATKKTAIKKTVDVASFALWVIWSVVVASPVTDKGEWAPDLPRSLSKDPNLVSLD